MSFDIAIGEGKVFTCGKCMDNYHNTHHSKEEIKEIVREVLGESVKLSVNGEWCHVVGHEVKVKNPAIFPPMYAKEWPQLGDKMFYICDRGRVREAQMGYDDSWKESLEFGNVFQAEEEAEAVRDLRKHEVKCRFTMEDFEDMAYVVSNDFTVAINRAERVSRAFVENTVFPTEELAQERAQILQRLAKIRGLI